MSEIPGFARAQRAWENMEPSSGGCDCLDQEVYLCDACGEEWPRANRKPCDCEDTERVRANEEWLIENAPVCAYHRSCGGCGDCPECGNIGDPDL